MNKIVRLEDIFGCSAAKPKLSAPKLPDRITLGMPHLSANGLSEGWLLKELGHRHWFLLAEAAGMAVPDFRTASGEPVYAAFRAVSLSGCDLAAACENDVLTLSSSLEPLSRTQVSSRHRLTIAGRPIGTIELLSTFVKRDVGGGNHTVARIAVDGLSPKRTQAPANGIAARAAAFRSAPAAELARFTFDPCPSQDFNGAGFLYFTSFLALVDRAEWQFDRACALTATTASRDIFYRGNIDPGETVAVALLAHRTTTDGVAHHCRLLRVTDGAIIADVFSVRARTSDRHDRHPIQ